MEYRCAFCHTPLSVEKQVDPVLQMMFDEIKHFCSDECMFAEFEKREQASADFENLESGTIQ